jgi:adenylate cyclase, class 2
LESLVALARLIEYKRPVMAMAMLEREVKLRFDSADEAREAIEATGATPLRCRRLQEDALLDDRSESLRARGCMLRVRVESGKSLLTFKGPVQPSAMKLREELETIVGDGETMLRCFERLGYAVWFRYQKYRQEYSLGDVVIAIDETPIGVFVEIEGGERGILDAAESLGRSPADFVLDSYRALFMEHRRTHGLPVTDMVFDEQAGDEGPDELASV